jgi:hypothetical protein
LNSTIIFAAARYEIGKATLIKWEEDIKNDFESRNAFDEFKISSDEPALLHIL